MFRSSPTNQANPTPAVHGTAAALRTQHVMAFGLLSEPNPGLVPVGHDLVGD